MKKCCTLSDYKMLRMKSCGILWFYMKTVFNNSHITPLIILCKNFQKVTGRNLIQCPWSLLFATLIHFKSNDFSSLMLNVGKQMFRGTLASSSVPEWKFSILSVQDTRSLFGSSNNKDLEFMQVKRKVTIAKRNGHLPFTQRRTTIINKL